LIAWAIRCAGAEVHLKSGTIAPFEVKKFLATSGRDHSIKKFAKGTVISEQGEPAAAIFFIKAGKVKITVLSTGGKEAVVGVLSVGHSLVKAH
jgi:CRP/FNR family transcriptional regulator, cyclic AMP receptor protein